MKSLITKCRSEILQQKKFFAFFIDLQRKRRKQNHKISFHFFAAPPCTPRRFFERKEIFGFGSRLEGARGALYSLHHTIGAYAKGLHHHALGACDYFSLRSKKVRISSYRRSQLGLSASSSTKLNGEAIENSSFFPFTVGF